MTYRCAALGIGFLAVAGCTMANPQFELSTASQATSGGAEDSGTTAVTPTGGPGTSTTGPETGGAETSTTGVETTQTVTSMAETSMAETTQAATSTDGSTTQSDTGGAACGNGKVDSDQEQCDDGNAIDNDMCTNACTKPVCGDDIVQGAEECDDANMIEDDGCTSNCVLTACGDGVVQVSEQCDDGDKIDDDECTNACTDPVCGDGVIQVQKGEQCDAGPLNGTKEGNCFEDCSVVLNPVFLKIQVLGDFTTGLIGGIAGGDLKCQTKFNDNKNIYRMLAADGVERIATKTGYKSDSPVDWVLHPYRIYVNAKDELVFITGPERLLGVRKQNPVPLVHPIHGESVKVWTGMDKSWVANVNCKLWNLGTNLASGGFGMANVAQDGSFIGADTQLCNADKTTIYCVQVPG